MHQLSARHSSSVLHDVSNSKFILYLTVVRRGERRHDYSAFYMYMFHECPSEY